MSTKLCGDSNHQMIYIFGASALDATSQMLRRKVVGRTRIRRAFDWRVLKRRADTNTIVTTSVAQVREALFSVPTVVVRTSKRKISVLSSNA